MELPDWIHNDGHVDFTDYGYKNNHIYHNKCENQIIIKSIHQKITQLSWISPQCKVYASDDKLFFCDIEKVWWSNSTRTMFITIACHHNFFDIRSICFCIAYLHTNGFYNCKQLKLQTNLNVTVGHIT